MDNSINSFQPVDCHHGCDDRDIDAVSNNPMAMADARSLAQQVMNDVINELESMGIEVNESASEIEGMTQGLSDVIMQMALDRIQNQGGNEEGNRAKAGEGGSAAGGGTSIFERIALALGTAMVEKANELVELAESVPNASDGDVLLQSAKVTAAGQELNVLSQTFNSTINSVGQAASTAARKQ